MDQDTTNADTSMDDSEAESETSQVNLPHSKRPRLDRTAREASTSSSSSTGGSGRFKNSWNIPYIVESTRGSKYARCKLCQRDFSVAHGGHNDAKRHCESSGHQKRYGELQFTLCIVHRHRGPNFFA